jgi:alkanesulfonate monooxygenase SsuD/methylene tetrahydromethanopterin reductase-like flavin-dependent oxidoreductase (luciferase family)
MKFGWMSLSLSRIGFAVIQMALHHPVRLAIQLAVLDNLSRGRLDVGIGRGSTYNEYESVLVLLSACGRTS